MVVEHDHVAAGGRERLVTEGAAIDADDQVVALAEPAHRRHVRPVALVDPVGDVERRAEAHPPQPDQDQRRRGAAVDVVVGEDGDPLAAPSPPAGSARPPGPCRAATTGRASGRAAPARGAAPPRPARRRAAPAPGRRSRAGPSPARSASPSRSTSGSGPSQRRPVTDASTPRKAGVSSISAARAGRRGGPSGARRPRPPTSRHAAASAPGSPDRRCGLVLPRSPTMSSRASSRSC